MAEKTEKKGGQPHVRNMGIMAHIDAGKTTLSERLLYITGRIHQMGEVHEGQATMDWMIQEQERGITITSAVTAFQWGGSEVHLIDTPGHVDFTIEVERSLRVLDGVVTVLDGVAGVEPQTETVWRQADKFKVPRFVFVNKLDRMGASFDRCVESLRDHFGYDRTIIPVQIPIGQEADHQGVIDLIAMKALTWHTDDPIETTTAEIPGHLLADAQAARQRLIELLADHDERIGEAFLEGEEVSNVLILEALRAGTITNRLVPVLCGSALKNKGIPPVLDGIVRYLPSPDDIATYSGFDPKTGEMVERPLGSKGPLCALAYKVMIMEDGRKMTFVRIYSGKLKVGEAVLNINKKVEEKISRIFVMHANQRTRVETAEAGTIVGVLGLKDTRTGDTLCDPKEPLSLESIAGKEPVIYQAVEPMTSAEKDKLDEVLGKLAEEDPTFRTFEDPETGERVISGMGELHLEIIVDRVKRQFGLETRVGKPQVVYKETLSGSATEAAVFDRVHEEKRLFGSVKMHVAAAERGAGIRFVAKCTKAPFHLPEWLNVIREGALEAVKSGPIQGNAMDDVVVTFEDAEFQEGVSVPLAYRIAANEAVRRACEKAGPCQMEPIMVVEISVPDEGLGAAIASVNERKGRVENMSETPQYRLVRAKVPLRAMFGYAKDLRTRTQGRGSFQMKFSHYDIML